MFSQISKSSQAVADTLSFSGDTVISAIIDGAIIAAFAIALIAPPSSTHRYVEEKFETRPMISTDILGIPEHDLKGNAPSQTL